ncbi:hypothetical protein FRC01_008575 [Tulasnella sp. 417]|nr:hypothetical protein FRC01_008575 [Tulasnella sp. 417]
MAGNPPHHKCHVRGVAVDYGSPKADSRNVGDYQEDFEVTKAVLELPRTRDSTATAWCNPDTKNIEPVAQSRIALCNGEGPSGGDIALGQLDEGEIFPQDLGVTARQPLGMLDQNSALNGQGQAILQANTVEDSEDAVTPPGIVRYTLKLKRPTPPSG